MKVALLGTTDSRATAPSNITAQQQVQECGTLTIQAAPEFDPELVVPVSCNVSPLNPQSLDTEVSFEATVENRNETGAAFIIDFNWAVGNQLATIAQSGRQVLGPGERTTVSFSRSLRFPVADPNGIVQPGNSGSLSYTIGNITETSLPVSNAPIKTSGCGCNHDSQRPRNPLKTAIGR